MLDYSLNVEDFFSPMRLTVYITPDLAIQIHAQNLMASSQVGVLELNTWTHFTYQQNIDETFFFTTHLVYLNAWEMVRLKVPWWENDRHYLHIFPQSPLWIGSFNDSWKYMHGKITDIYYYN
jgi:hypothetical protein